MFAQGLTVAGERRLLGAAIGGELNVSGATVRNPDGRALYLVGATISGGLFALDGLNADGEVRALGATIGGPSVTFWAIKAQPIRSSTEYAARRIHVRQRLDVPQ